MTPRHSQAFPSASVQSASEECGSSMTARLKASSADTANKSSETRVRKMAAFRDSTIRAEEQHEFGSS